MTLRVDSQALAPPVASRQSKEPRGEPPPDPGGGFAHLLAAWTAVAEGRDRTGDTAASAAGEAAAEGGRTPAEQGTAGPAKRGGAAPIELATGLGSPLGEAPEECAPAGASAAPAGSTGAGPLTAQGPPPPAGDPGSGERRSPGTGAATLPTQPQVASAGEPRVAPTGQPQGAATGEPAARSGAGLSTSLVGVASPAGVPAPAGAAGQERSAGPPTQPPAAGASDGAAGQPSVVFSDESPAAGDHAAAPPSAPDTSAGAQLPQSPRQSPAPPPAGVTATDGAQRAPAGPPGAQPAPDSPPTAASDQPHRAPQTTFGEGRKTAGTTVAERPGSAAAAGDGAAASTAGAATSSAGAATSGTGTTPSAGGPSVAQLPHQRLFEAARTAVWTLATRGGQHARLRLRPPTLGELEVRLHERPGGLEVRILASEESSARALAATADQLRRALERHDLRVATLEVESAPASSLGSGAPSERQGADGRSPSGAPAEGQAASNASLRLASGEGEEEAAEATARTVVVARGFVIDVLA